MWGNLLKIALGLAAAGLVAYGSYKIYKKITAQAIAEKVAREAKNAVKAKIKSAKRYEVGVDLFGKNGEHIGDMTIESPEGVDSSLRVGQLIAVI